MNLPLEISVVLDRLRLVKGHSAPRVYGEETEPVMIRNQIQCDLWEVVRWLIKEVPESSKES